MKQTVTIIGCGWLGLPLAEYLIKQGFIVKGSTTDKSKLNVLKKKNIEPFHLELNPEIAGENIDELLNSDILIINIPPGRKRDNVIDFHFKQISNLILEVEKSSIAKIIFISSTSVYGNLNKVVKEDDDNNPESDSGKALRKVEDFLLENNKFKTTIIRFGGLIGKDRHPVKYFTGRKNIPGGNTPVNLIHLNDCIKIIFEIIKQNKWKEIYNAVADKHPAKKDVYTEAAKLNGLPTPEFLNDVDDHKIVSNEKLRSQLKYSFEFPDPVKMIETA